MGKFTTQELKDLIGSGNDFAVQIATQLLAAESIIKAVREYADSLWHRGKGKGINAYYIQCADELHALIKKQNATL